MEDLRLSEIWINCRRPGESFTIENTGDTPLTIMPNGASLVAKGKCNITVDGKLVIFPDETTPDQVPE